MQNFPEKNPKILALLVLFRVFFHRKFSNFFFFERNTKKYEFSAKKKTNFVKGFPNFAGKPTPSF